MGPRCRKSHCDASQRSHVVQRGVSCFLSLSMEHRLGEILAIFFFLLRNFSHCHNSQAKTEYLRRCVVGSEWLSESQIWKLLCLKLVGSLLLTVENLDLEMATYTEFHQPDSFRPSTPQICCRITGMGKNGLFFGTTGVRRSLKCTSPMDWLPKRRPTSKTITKELEVLRHCKCSTKKPPNLILAGCEINTTQLEYENFMTCPNSKQQARIDASLSPLHQSLVAPELPSMIAFSLTVKNADKPKKHAPPVLKAKSLEKSKPRPLHVTSKRDNHLLPSKCNTRGAASENNSNHVFSRKKLTEVCSSATVPHPSSTRSRLVPSYPSGRSDPKKANSNNKKLADRLQTNLPVHARSVQVDHLNTSNETSIACGLKNMAVEKRSCIGVSRKLLDLGNQQCDGSFTNNPARVDSERKNYGKERKEKEGKEENNAANRRYPKPASTVTSSVHKNVKVVRKIAELKSGILPHSKCQARSSSPVKSMGPVQQEECAVAFIMRQSLQKQARTSAIDWNVHLEMLSSDEAQKFRKFILDLKMTMLSAELNQSLVTCDREHAGQQD
ncbi:Targeting protein for Xklp2 protein family [Prunus dulcis]|uniref:Targeting protein for Xklp2 protein family n=1 Tax=Prunus dulcis TaxID=3755 RepID=A0A4Y1QVU4_PRUDU|nr:Targeting protein for Xklp2 protein family [Prunus dulcis]